MANTGFANVNQSGFIGGGQIGYNWQVGPSFVFGVEADIQGTTIRGSGSYVGAVQDSMSFVDPSQGLPCNNNASNTCNLSRSAVGGGQIRAGVDWMGTVRGRIGYLFTPTLLLYGTGGLAYGGTHASAGHSVAINGSVSGLQPPYDSFNGGLTLPAFPGASSYSDTRVGWTAGGGAEWMFLPNWSVKAEALYYSLGNVTLVSSPIVAVSPVAVPSFALGTAVSSGQPLIANVASTRVSYQGVIARAGVNYHFNWGSTAPVLARY